MSNLLKNIFSGLGKIGDKSGDSAVGIDIGSSSIKVVEIKRKGARAVLETYGSIALGPYADIEIGRITNLPVEKMSTALTEVLRQSGVSGKTVAMSIPVQSSLIFAIDLPAQVSESEIASIVPTEARKYIPVPITEVSIDYFILPKREQSFEEINDPDVPAIPVDKKSILVVATQNDAVAKHKSILSQSNLGSAFFEIEIFSSLRANFEHELSPVLLIDFGASRTKLSIVEFGVVKVYHTVERGGSDITGSIATSLDVSFTDAEKMKKDYGLFENPTDKNLADIIKVHLDYIFSETNNVLLAYEKKNERAISKVIFTGGGSLLKGLREVAQNNFRAEIEIGHPFSKVEAPEFLQKVLEAMGPEFAVAIGLALRQLQQ